MTTKRTEVVWMHVGDLNKGDVVRTRYKCSNCEFQFATINPAEKVLERMRFCPQCGRRIKKIIAANRSTK